MENINVDDVVIIISPCQTTGMEGIVRKISYPYSNGFKYISVYIPKIDEVRSYNALSIKLKNRKDKSVMNNNFKDCKEVVGVKFLQGYNTNKEYSFASYEDEIKVGNLVLCDANQGFEIAKVVNVYTKENAKINPTKEIIAIINTDAFNKRKELKAKRHELRNRMDRKVKELQNIAIYEMLAEKDPDLAQMLEEFKALS